MKDLCCFWCHKTDGEMFVNKSTGTVHCKSCKADPVLNKWKDKCDGKHKVQAVTK